MSIPRFLAGVFLLCLIMAGSLYAERPKSAADPAWNSVGLCLFMARSLFSQKTESAVEQPPPSERVAAQPPPSKNAAAPPYTFTHTFTTRGQLTGRLPDKDALFYDSESNLAIGRLLASAEVGAKYKHISLTVKDTAVLSSAGVQGVGTRYTDYYNQESYLSLDVFEALPIRIGKVNQAGGVSYASNPVDYFRQNSTIFGPEADNQHQREMRPGAYMVKADWFLPKVTLTGVFAPRITSDGREWAGNQSDQYLLKASLSAFQDYNPEFLFYWGADSPHFGLDWTGSLTEKAILQFELSTAQGSNVQPVALNPAAPQTSLQDFSPRSDAKWYTRAVLGINYMLPKQINFIGEYIYRQDGLSADEIETHSRFLDTSRRFSADPTLGNMRGLYKSYYGQAVAAYDPSNLARSYLFLRVSRDNLGSQKLNGSCNFNLNLEDFSAVVYPRLDYLINGHFTASGGIYSFWGKRYSEFGWVPDRLRVVVELTRYF